MLNKILQKYKNRESGVVALMIAVIILSISIVLAVSVSLVFLSRLSATRNIALSEKSYFAAEAGIEDALLRELNPSLAPAETPYVLDVGDVYTTIDKSSTLNTITIDSNGNASDRVRSLRVEIGIDPAGTTFSFAAHIGERGLDMESNAIVNGNAYSNGDIVGQSNTEIDGNASAVGIITSPNPEVSGTREEGADHIDLPPFDEEGWAEQANINNDPIIGDLLLEDGTTTLGPRKIEGNLTMGGNAELIVTGPIHITGDFVMDSNTAVFLDNSFESDGTTIFVEGVVQFKSNSIIHATEADPAGYVMIASTSTSDEAILVDSNSELETVIYAVNGDVVMNSNGDVVALIGNGVLLKSNAVINFDLGLITYTYTTGGQGSYAIIKWEEQ